MPSAQNTPSRLVRGIRNPRTAWRVMMSRVRAGVFLWLARIRGQRFECGRGFRLEGRLILKGPGKVILGDHVRVAQTVTPWTASAEAVIRIGARTFVNGTSFGCAREISIGEDCILARASIMDTDFHSTRTDRQSPDAPVRVAPVRIEDNVWVAAQAGILPGTHIGKNSVIGFGAICSGDYPPDSIIAGNPARVVKPVPRPPAE